MHILNGPEVEIAWIYYEDDIFTLACLWPPRERVQDRHIWTYNPDCNCRLCVREKQKRAHTQ